MTLEMDPSGKTEAGDGTLGSDQTLLGNDDTLTDDARVGSEFASSTRIGRYIVLEQLGKGGMGVVVSAYDPKLDRRVAIKLIHTQRQDQHDPRVRMEREAQAMARLSHPNVVTVYEVGEHEGRLFVAMEFVEGQDLGKWLAAREQPIDWRATLGMFLQAGRGLAAAHQAGLVHRDFKPDNVFVGKDGRARVGDFGIVRREGERVEPSNVRIDASRVDALAQPLTHTGATMGTPCYMAPEQFEGVSTDARTDQFAFCVALWMALYGQPPFDAQTLAGLILEVCEGKLRPPPAKTRVPTWLRAVLERGLSTAPADRYPTTEQLLSALEADPTRRRWLWLGLAASVLALVAWLGTRDVLERRTAAACLAEGASIEASWNDDARTRLREALLATGVPYASSTAERVIARLDAQADAWQDARTLACTRTRVEASWDEETFTRSVWCLDERALGLAAVVDVLANLDADAMQDAVTTAAGLEPIDACLDARRLLIQPPLPDARERVREVQAAMAKAVALRSAARYDDALGVTERAMTTAQAIDWAPLTAKVGVLLGDLRDSVGDYPGAEATLEDAYFGALAGGALEPAADAASSLAYTVGYQQTRHVEGLRWARQAEVLLTLLGVEDSPASLSTILNARGLIYDSMADYDAALPLFEQALAFDEQVFGADHPELAIDVANLARVQEARGDYEQALALAQRAVDITERALGPDHPYVGAYLDDLGSVYLAMGHSQQALEHYERGLALRERVLPPTHPEISSALADLALVHKQLGDYDEAVALNERALALRTAAFGPDHRLVAASLANLASVYLATGDYAQAEPLYQRAIAIDEVQLGSDHPTLASLLNGLGIVYRSTGRNAEARVAHERALDIRERAFGPDHPDVATDLGNLAAVVDALGEPERAKQLDERALDIRERVLGPNHPDVGLALNNLATVEAELGQADAAQAHFERALALLEAALGPDHPRLAPPSIGLARLALARQDAAAALPLAERGVRIHERAGVQGAKLADARFVLAQALWDAPEQQGRDRERACELTIAAREGLVDLPGVEPQRAAIEAFLASHGG